MNPQHPSPLDDQNGTAHESLLDRPTLNAQGFAQSACALLQRADLKGGEVPVYSEVWNTLQALGTLELRVIDAMQVQAIQSLEQTVRNQQELIARQNEHIEALQQQVIEDARALGKLPKGPAEAADGATTPTREDAAAG